MPHPPLIASATVRSVVMTAVMLLVLLVALGAASLLSSNRGMDLRRVGSLELLVPSQWEQAADTQQPSSALEVYGVFTNNTGARRLTVGLLPVGSGRTPTEALALGWMFLLGDQEYSTLEHQIDHSEFRAGTWIGVIATGISVVDQSNSVHIAATMTEDGRRYWVLCMSMRRWDTSQRAVLLHARRQLIDICSALRDDQRRDATSADLAAARLNSAAPRLIANLPLRIRRDTGLPNGAPIELIATAGPGQLHMARVLGTLDAGTDAEDPTANPPLEVGGLLRTMFQATMGRPPGGDEMWSGHIELAPGPASVEAWRISWSPTRAATKELQQLTGQWKRTLYYLRMGGGRGMLIELTGAVESDQQRRDWVPYIAAALAPPTSPDTTAQASLAHAVERGQAMAEAFSRYMQEQLRPGTYYYLIDRLGKPIGFELSRIAAGPDGLGRWRFVTTAPASGAPLQITQWRSTADGAHFSWHRRLLRPGQSGSIGQVLASDGQALRFTNLKADSEQETIWSMPRQPNYLPPWAIDIWPAVWLSVRDDAPTLVWQCAESNTAVRPYWIEQIKTDASAVQTSDQVQISIRPMMSLNAQRVTIDRDARRISRYHVPGWPDASALARSTDGFVTNMRQVDRQAVLDVFGGLAEQLAQWEQESLEND
jgi:hypothetical protein